MQAGFATLSAGSIRAKNVSNILLKNLLDACIGCVAFFLLGYGFAYDRDACVSKEDCAKPDAHKANAFIGTGPSNFALSGIKDYGEGYEAHGYDWITFFFQFTFAAAAATIVSGAVAERCQLIAYMVYSFGITGLVYPVVAHWVWDVNGCLSILNDDAIMGGVIDFAGSGVVHMTGGWAALVGAKVLGPRSGRFEDPAAFEGHSTPAPPCCFTEHRATWHASRSPQRSPALSRASRASSSRSSCRPSSAAPATTSSATLVTRC